MSNDRIDSGHSHDESGPEPSVDGPLLTQLQAFGATLSAATETRITPERKQPPDARLSRPADVVPITRPDRRSRYLIAVAAVAIIMGVGLVSVWSGSGGDPSDPTSTASAADRESDSESDIESDTESDTEADPDLLPDPDTEDEGETAAQPDTPSVITGSDGLALATINDSSQLLESAAEPWGVSYQRSDDSQSTSPADDDDIVIARAVVDELIELDLPGVGEERNQVVDALLTGGLRITTTIDPIAMDLARQTIREQVPEGDRSDELGLITVDNRTGAIVAVGSTAPTAPVMTEWQLPPGSAFKSLVLATLFEQGYQPDDLVATMGPCSFATDSSTLTVGGGFRGDSSIASATRSSNNCAFVRLGLIAGLDEVVDRAEMVGLAQPEGAELLPLLSLGTTTARGVDLAGAYAAFANNGRYRKPWLIQEVLDADGRSIYRSTPAAAGWKQVMSAKTADMITAVLASNVERGTGRRAMLEDHAAAGKTGTTNNFENAWFIGYTDSYTTAVWLGDPTRLRVPEWRGFGGGLPALVWGTYNTELNRGIDPVPFDPAPEPAREPIVIERPESELVPPDQFPPQDD